MDKWLAKKYYERPEIQKALLAFANQREVGLRYDGYFGKRPDVIEYLSDIRVFVKQGVFSFHMSEERWINPLMLGNDKLADSEKDKNRAGWDLILDLDGKDLIHSKIVGTLILDHLTELGVKNISVKFSGNKGYHIGIPFEAFSSNIIGIGETRLLFPEAARRIGSYLIVELQGKIAKGVLDYEGGIEKTAKKYGFEVEDLQVDDPKTHNFDYMKIIDIDTILISSRHLFRMPYSLHEKSSLVSIPVRNDALMDFEKFLAKPEKVDPQKYKDFEFLRYDSSHGKDADVLLLKAYEDDYTEMISSSLMTSKKNSEFTYEFTEKVERKDFPNTIQYVLSEQFEDGRKRAVFLLLTFLHAIKWDQEHIEQTINDWNDNQANGLKAQYIKAQISWFKAQPKAISPPNFSNANYYEGIGIPKQIIQEDKQAFRNREVKNPLHYVILLQSTKQKVKGKGKKKK